MITETLEISSKKENSEISARFDCLDLSNEF